MINVKFTTPSPLLPLERFTPGYKGVWGDCQFFVDRPTGPVDWWVVQENLSKTEQAICSPENTILITQETEFMKKYDQKFLDQFGTIITCQRTMKHPRKIYTQQAHLWHVGWFGSGSGVDPKDYKKMFASYDKLKSITEIKKNKLISVVTSHKNHTPGQDLRRKFITAMKEHFGDRLDVFGTGINYLKDKWDGIAPYKYHLAIENSYVPDYWTEKLADAYLGGAYPIYYGHKNVLDYFSPDALSIIDINDIPGSITTIEKILAENYYEKHIKDIWEARNLVLDKYNIFALADDTIHKLTSEGTPEFITLQPEKRPWLKKRIVETLRGKKVLYNTARKLYRSYRKLKN